jgi:hypothetical protein
MTESEQNANPMYKKVCFNIPTAYMDEILNYLESEYALYPITKKCFGIGPDKPEDCANCDDTEECLEECETRAERSCAWL